MDIRRAAAPTPMIRMRRLQTTPKQAYRCGAKDQFRLVERAPVSLERPINGVYSCASAPGVGSRRMRSEAVSGAGNR
jgi:hypothetical protein